MRAKVKNGAAGLVLMWVVVGVGMGMVVEQGAAQTARQATEPRQTTPGAAGVDLRARFVAGRVTRYVMEMISANALKSSSTPELNQDQTQEERIELVLKVKSASAEGAEIELAYERLVAKLKTPDGEFSADSAAKTGAKPGQRPATTPGQKTSGRPGSKRSAPAPSAAPATTPATTPGLDEFASLDMNDALKQYVDGAAGTVLTIKTDGAGNLVSVTGGGQLGGGALSGLGGGGGLGGGMMGANPNAMANWVVGGLGAPGSVQVGQKWTTSSSLQGTPLGAFGMNTTYTLRSANGGQARVEFRGNAEGQSAAASLMPGFQLKGASYSGEATWDAREGELAGMTASTDVSLGGNVGGIAAEMTAKQRVKVTRGR